MVAGLDGHRSDGPVHQFDGPLPVSDRSGQRSAVVAGGRHVAQDSAALRAADDSTAAIFAFEGVLSGAQRGDDL